MNFTISHLLTLALIAAATSCIAQTGTVTFYSIGMSANEVVKDAVVPVGTAPFTGWLFDGNKRLAHFQRGRFVSFRLAEGEHQFTVPYHSNGPGKKTVLSLKVESGGNYCVRLYAKYVSGSVLVPIAFVDSQIEQLSCPEAVKEAASYKPLDLKRVDPAAQTNLEGSQSFPIGN